MAGIALLAWFGLAFQFYIIVQAAVDTNKSLPGEILRFFSYFTILTNLLVAISLTSMMVKPSGSWGKFFSRPPVQAAIALYIGVVGLVYVVALANIWNPVGLQLVADRLLHYVVPFFFIFYWAFFAPKKSLQWKHPLWWLIYPAAYLVFVLIRGALVNAYPYYFIDSTQLPWSEVIRNMFVLFAVFAGLGFLLVGISRLFKTS